MKNKNKFMILLIIATFLVALGAGAYSYAKYLTKTTNNTTASFARWYITLNGEDINSTKKKDITIVQEANEHIADGVIAPTSVAYFDIDVDATKTDVDLQYTISITKSDDSAIRDFSIDKMVDKTTGESTIGDGQTISGTMYVLNDDGTRNENKTISKRIYIKWVDDPEDGTINTNMTNEEDTEAAEWITTKDEDGNDILVKQEGIVNVTIEFKQIPKSS